jgi:UDP:flavonoid glycosyltransferase YjiC (YdhE family)
VLTVGGAVDPAGLGPQPAHVHVERNVPQSLLLPRCDLVVCQGGSGTVVAALAHGLPLVVIPPGVDQPANAERVAALGMGRSVGPEERTAGRPRGILLTASNVCQHERRTGSLGRAARSVRGFSVSPPTALRERRRGYTAR